MVQRSGRGAWPRLGLSIEGWPALVRHFEAEYGAAAPPDAGASVGLVVRPLERGASSPAGDRAVHTGRHKTTSWSIRLSDPTLNAIHCELAIRGVFGRSLVQSAVVEPLLEIALARADRALLPAAGIVVDGRALVLAGASRSGKSSLALRAWAAGRQLLGDDHVILDPDGMLSSFPRRLRAYPDLSRTAPAAVERLGGQVRRSLTAAGLVRRLTRGWVGLPVLVPGDAIIRPAAAAPVPLGRLVVIDRDDEAGRLGWTMDPEAAWSRLEAIVDRDLASISAVDSGWAAAASRARTRMLELCLGAAAATRAEAAVLTVPGRWRAEEAIGAVERELGLAS